MNDLLEAVNQRHLEEDALFDQATLAELQQEAETRMYGSTVAELKQAVESSKIYQYEGAVDLANYLIADCQDRLNYVNTNRQDLRQQLNRVRWILNTYVKGN